MEQRVTRRNTFPVPKLWNHDELPVCKEHFNCTEVTGATESWGKTLQPVICTRHSVTSQPLRGLDCVNLCLSCDHPGPSASPGSLHMQFICWEELIKTALLGQRGDSSNFYLSPLTPVVWEIVFFLTFSSSWLLITDFTTPLSLHNCLFLDSSWAQNWSDLMIFSIASIIVDESLPGQTPAQTSSFQHLLCTCWTNSLHITCRSDHRSGRRGIIGADGPAA